MEQAVIAALRVLESKRGEISAEAVLKAAKNPRSPLHALFEWDDSKAAHQFRLDQARGVIRDYKVVVTTTNTTRRVQAFIHKPASEGGGYVSVSALKQEDNATRNAKLLLENSKHMAGNLENLCAVAAVLDVCVPEFQAAQAAVRTLMLALEEALVKKKAA